MIYYRQIFFVTRRDDWLNRAGHIQPGESEIGLSSNFLPPACLDAKPADVLADPRLFN